MLARHFPKPELPTRVQAIGAPSPTLSAELVVPEPVMATEPRPRVAPLSPQRFALQLTMDQATHHKLCYAQELLGHTVPSGDIARVFGRALDALIRELEKTKFAATSRPRPRPRRPTAARAAAERAAEESRAAAAVRAKTVAAAEEVIPYLRSLGCKAGEAREAAALCEAIPDASLEERLRRALMSLGPRGVRRIPYRGSESDHARSGPAP